MLKSLDESLIRASSVRTRGGHTLRLHCIVFSFVAEVPEIKELSAVLNGNQRVRYQILCFEKFDTFSESTQAPLQSLDRKISKLNNMEDLRKASVREDHINDNYLSSALQFQAQHVLVKESIEAYITFYLCQEQVHSRFFSLQNVFFMLGSVRNLLI